MLRAVKSKRMAPGLMPERYIKELKVDKDFTIWLKGRIKKYEFIENEDWKLTFAKTGERRNVKVNKYSLTLDMAKELPMVRITRLDTECGWEIYSHLKDGGIYIE